MRRIALTITLALAPNAHGETVWQVSDSFWVWSGGSASRSGNAWFGNGWDKFPGVNPPWNPVAPMPFAPAPQIVIELPDPVFRPAPTPPVPTGSWIVVPGPEPTPVTTYYLRIGNELIPQTGRW